MTTGSPATGDATGSAAPAVGPVVALAVGASALAATLSIWLSGVRQPHIGPVPWVVLAAVFAVTESFPVHFEHRRESISMSLSTVPLVVGLYATGPVGIIAARLVGSALALVLHRRQVSLKLLVNLSAFWVETAVAAAIFTLLHHGRGVGPASWVAAFAAAIGGDFALTVVLVVAISLYQRRMEDTIVRSAVIDTLGPIVDTCFALVAVTLLDSEPAALALMAVISAMMLISYRAHRAFREKHRNLEQLYDFTSRIGESLAKGTVTETLLEQAREIMHADRAWLLVTTGSAMHRIDVTGQQLTTHVVEKDSFDAYLHGLVQSSGRAMLIHPSDGPIVSGHETDLAIAGPLPGSSQTAGTLVVADRSGDVRPFGAEDLHLFSTLASHAGVSLENSELVTRLRDQVEETLYQSLHDGLTDLPNRTLFTQRLDESLMTGRALAVLLLDLDRFKEVNDTLGHHSGDVLLQQVGLRLRSALRHGDVIARLGGDEFGILLDDITAAEGAVQVARGIATVLEQPFSIGDVRIDVGASIGITIAPDHGRDSSLLLQRADVAMYTAKRDQTTVALYQTERDQYSPERLALVGELRRAIDERQLQVYYQPQLALDTQEVVGVEALVRWVHPEKGIIPPDNFISVAEHTGLIGPLTTFVLTQSLEDCAAWHRAGHDLRVSVNISARSLLQPEFESDVARILSAARFPADRLCLELTESTIMSDTRRSTEVLERLRALGLTIAIDDFGTGHSSLAYLKDLPVGELKIDKSFVLSMDSNGGDRAIVHTIVDLARNLGLPVVAEGVENEVLAALLKEFGCPVGQGYLYAKPLPAEQMSHWLDQHLTMADASVIVPMLGAVAARPRR